MVHRGYALIDFDPPPDLWADRERLVRFMEYVRMNVNRIVNDVPAGCEVDLFASGHAHNPGLVPLIGLWAPAAVVDHVPDSNQMIHEVSAWCSRLRAEEVDAIVATTAAPTWEDLVRVGVHPTRRDDA